MTRKIQLPQIQNVGPGQRATLRLPLGVTYNKICLFGGGGLGHDYMRNIVLKVNGSERMRFSTGQQLVMRNIYNGNNHTQGIVELDFINRNAKDEAAMTLGAYAATAQAGVQDMSLEFDLIAYNADSTTTIKAVAEIDVPSANRLITRNRYFQKVLAGAVEEQIVIPSGLNGEQLQRIYIYGPTENIASVRVRREGADEFDALTRSQNEFFQRTYGKVPQQGLFVVDFTEHNLAGHMLNTSMIIGADGKPVPIQNLDIRMKTVAAGTFDIYTESITTSDRP